MSDTATRVILIDDDADDYIIIKSLLNDIKNTAYEIKWISNSKEGIDALKKQEADIYLVDYQIDAKTGIDLLEQIDTQSFNKSFILLTGTADYDIDVRAMNKGASDFLSKHNLTSELLEKSIRYSIRNSEMREVLKEREKLKAEKEAADNLTKIKSIFFSNIGHEIRNPLNIITGSADLALDESLSKKQHYECIEIIKRNSDALLKIINDFLDFSKAEMGQLKISASPFNWQDCTKEVLESFKPLHKNRLLNINFTFASDIPPVLISDSLRFRQILVNIVGNAIKFTGNGEINITAGILQSNPNTSFFIDVKDTGTGIEKDEQEKLFSAFQQSNPGICASYGGTGLGLSFSRQLAQLLGGNLVLTQSEKGKGSTFRITLPANFGEANMKLMDRKKFLSSHESYADRTL